MCELSSWFLSRTCNLCYMSCLTGVLVWFSVPITGEMPRLQWLAVRTLLDCAVLPVPVGVIRWTGNYWETTQNIGQQLTEKTDRKIAIKAELAYGVGWGFLIYFIIKSWLSRFFSPFIQLNLRIIAICI